MKEEVITSYKGFDSNMQCRDFQYEIGESYKHKGKVELCMSGFHACPTPLDVFGYYQPASSQFAIVEQSGKMDKGDDKITSSKIAIKTEINFMGIVKAQIEWVKSNIKIEKEESANEDYSAASNTGNRSAASNTGDYSAASNTGYCSAASNTGNYSAASNTGDYSAASNTGDCSAASNTGNRSAASNTGNRSAASVEGKESIAFACGYESKAKASKGSWIVLAERNDEGEILNVKTAKAGTDIKPDVYYMLVDGEFVEADKEESINTAV